MANWENNLLIICPAWRPEDRARKKIANNFGDKERIKNIGIGMIKSEFEMLISNFFASVILEYRDLLGTAEVGVVIYFWKLINLIW